MAIKKHTTGYALLFTLIIVTIIMTLVMGMSNSANKQLILSSTARNSQIAFYQADTAGECALYIATKKPIIPGTSISCGADGSNNLISLDVSQTSGGTYLLAPGSSFLLQEPCFNIEIDSTSTNLYSVLIKAKGYNICDPNSQNQLERGVEITY